MTDKIFVSIASYRDPETIPTILDALNKAEYKDRIIFGLVSQDDGQNSLDSIRNNDNIKILEYDWRESFGTCWARSMVQETLYDNEKYYLQIDSHQRFCENWDSVLINLIEETRISHSKPIIGGYCQGYEPANVVLRDSPCRICCYPDFTNEGDLIFFPKTIRNFKKLREENIKVIPARFLSGHFLFSDGTLCSECPYDPNLYFRGEELSLSARAYTSGYDLFHPVQSIIWHEYIRENKEKHWNNHTTDNGFIITAENRSKNAKARVRALLGMDSSNLIFNRYGLGKNRSLHEYELYAGLDFKNRRVHKNSYDIKDRNINPSVLSELEWNNGLMHKYRVQFSIPEKELKEIKQPETSIVNLTFKNKANLPVYKKDIKKNQIYSMKTNFLLESSMEEKPSKLNLISIGSQNPKQLLINELTITNA